MFNPLSPCFALINSIKEGTLGKVPGAATGR